MSTKQLKSKAVKMLSGEAKKFMAEDRVLVYHYRANGHPVVKDGLAVIPRHELDEILRTHPNLQTTKKAIPARARSVDIFARDLLPPVAEDAKTNGTEASNVAGVTLPVIVWLEGLLRGKGKGFAELVMLSERLRAPTPAEVRV